MPNWVADYTARIAPAVLKAAGVVGVCRYVSRSSWKVIDRAEFDELRAAGIAVVLNFEDEAAGWLGGAAAGTADADFAASAADMLGYPKGGPIPSSADFNMTSAQWAAVGREYAVAYRDGLHGRGYRPGVYGPWDVLGWCRSVGYDWFWQAGMSTAWSGGRNANTWPGAQLRQRRHTTVGGTDVDWNDILSSDWHGASVTTGGVLMALTDQQQTNLYYEVAGGNIKAPSDGSGTPLHVWLAQYLAEFRAAVAKLEAAPGGAAPTDQQVNAAVLAALQDPGVQSGIADKVLAGLEAKLAAAGRALEQ